MAMNRRDFLKVTAGSGLLLASDPIPSFAASRKELPPEAVGILYDATLCIGCKSCMVNCKKENSKPGGALYTEGEGVPYEYDPLKIYDAPTELSDKTLNIIKMQTDGAGEHKDQAGNGYSFVKQHCLHCIDPSCASVCPVGALHKDPVNGVVAYDKSKCIGCRYCQIACPFGIPQFEWGSASPRIVKCQLCHHRYNEGKYSACCEFCPSGASIFGKVKDLRKEAERRLSLETGSYYDFPVQTVDSTHRVEGRVSKYIDHLYGMNEAGGTQYMLLAGLPFEQLGFNPNISEEAYPDLTWGYINKIPVLIALLLAAGTISHTMTRRDKKEE